MKSAYELAMERMGLDEETYTDKQKARLSKIDEEYDTKVKEIKFSAEEDLPKAAGDPEKTQQIKDRLAGNLESLKAKREKEKNVIRNAGH